VIVADVNVERTQALAMSLPGAKAVHIDVTNREPIDIAAAHLDRLDILVNNAGIAHVGTIAEVEPNDFDHLMEVNVKSVYLVTRALLPLLLKTRGSIVNVGSVAGQVGIKQRFAYCTTKGAVLAMTRQLAVEYPKELRVNCICPGTVQTPFVEGYLDRYHAHEKEKIRVELNERQPIGRLGKPEEIASLIRYVCSDEAGFMTGSLLPIDGGWTAA
jgi:2-keto-3-deoxy-L-fuconate dehydrogenase